MRHAIKATLLSLTVSFLGATSAKASQFFNFSYQGTTDGRTVEVFDGELEAVQPSANPYEWLAVGISGGRYNGLFTQPFSELIAPGGSLGNDNLFYIGAVPQLNIGGIAYVAVNNTYIFYSRGADAGYSEAGPGLGIYLQTLTITPRGTPVPVPATLALFGLGLLGFGLTRAKRAL